MRGVWFLKRGLWVDEKEWNVSELILVRHGATEANQSGRYCGRLDPPLTEAGLAAVRETARQLIAFRPKRVYCSESLRTRQTAAVIAPGTELIFLPSLREIDFGAFEGLSADDIQRRMPELWRSYIENYRHFTFPDGDNVEKYLTKSAETIKAIVEESNHKDILIVSHKGFILSAISYLLHGDSDHIFCYDIRPAGYAKVAFTGGIPVLKQLV